MKRRVASSRTRSQAPFSVNSAFPADAHEGTRGGAQAPGHPAPGDHVDADEGPDAGKQARAEGGNRSWSTEVDLDGIHDREILVPLD